MAQALGHSIYTEADDWIGLRAAVREAVLCHFDEGKGPAMITHLQDNTAVMSG